MLTSTVYFRSAVFFGRNKNNCLAIAQATTLVAKDLEIVGKGDIVLQTEHILKNIETALDSCKATLDDLFKLTIYIVQGQDVRKGFEGAQNFIKRLSNPPVITGVIIAGLANPDYLVEIEAIAFKSESKTKKTARTR